MLYLCWKKPSVLVLLILSLFNLANECNMVFQGERFDQKQKIIHFLCFKDRYNNVIFPKVVNEDFVYTSGLHCLFSPISGFDYGCKNAIIGYALWMFF